MAKRAGAKVAAAPRPTTPVFRRKARRETLGSRKCMTLPRLGVSRRLLESGGGIRPRLAQAETLNLAGRRLRQLDDEVDPAGVLVWCEAGLAELQQLGCKGLIAALPVVEDDEGF